MKKKTKIDGVIVEVSDGDKDTDDITMLDGELAKEADDELVKRSIDILTRRGYEVRKRRPIPSESNGYNIGDFGLYD